MVIVQLIFLMDFYLMFLVTSLYIKVWMYVHMKPIVLF